MTLKITRTYTCNHCGKEDKDHSSELMLPEWFHVQLTPSILYGGASGDIPLRATNSLRFTGDYCSLECVHVAMRRAVEDFLESIREEVGKLNSRKQEQPDNNIGVRS